MLDWIAILTAEEWTALAAIIAAAGWAGLTPGGARKVFRRAIGKKAEPQLVLVAEPVSKAASPPSTVYVGIPFGRSVVGRHGEVGAIRIALTRRAEDGTQSDNSKIVLSGQPGIGKSALARNYIESYKSSYRGILWISAPTRQDVIIGFSSLCNTFDIEVPIQPQIHHAQSVIARITTDSREWLIVYDNVEDFEDLVGLVPHRSHVLITTRDGEGWDGWIKLKIDRLSYETFTSPATRLLMEVADRNEGEEAAQVLASDLGGLPLAIIVMGSYIRETGISFPLGRVRLSEILMKVPKNTGYPISVLGAVRLVFEQLSDDGKVTAQLCSFWAADGLGPWLLANSLESLAVEIPQDLVLPAALELLKDEARVAFAFDDLVAKSLLSGSGNARSMHRITSAAIRNIAGDALAPTATALLATAYPGGDGEFCVLDSGNWPLCSRLTPHVQALLDSRAAPEIAAWDYVLNQAGIYLSKIGDFSGRLRMAEESLRIKQGRLPISHQKIAVAHANLGVAYQRLNRLPEAEVELEKALSLDELHRPCSADLADSYDLLSGVLFCVSEIGSAARLPRALRLCQSGLVLRRVLFGHNSEPVAASLTRLAHIRNALGRGSAAHRLFVASLRIRRLVLRIDDARLAEACVNTGVSFLKLGVAERAEPLLKEGLRILETAFAFDPLHADRVVAAKWLVLCLLVRANSGVNRGVKDAAAKVLVKKYGLIMAEVEATAASLITHSQII